MITIKLIPSRAKLEAVKFASEQRGQLAGNIVGLVIGFILTFYVLSSTFPSLESSALALNTSLYNSQLSGVSAVSGLPAVAVVLFMLVTMFTLILVATRGG